MSKVTIIGAGSVGSTIAFNMTVKGLASEIVLIDVNENKALGEAMDIRQGTPICPPVTIYAGEYRDAAGSDIVVITSGMARKPGQSRLELTQANVNIIKSIAGQIAKYAPDAMYVLVANPVDINTYVFMKESGIPENHIIGTGTMLDTARLRSRLAQYLDVSQKNIHAYVLGEHGDSSFVPWSLAQVSTIPIDEYASCVGDANLKLPPLNHEEVEDYMRTSGATVIARKGATFYAISVATCYICETLLGSVDTVMCVSHMLHGEYGIDDVCLSIPCLIGPNGVSGKVLPKLTDDEIAKLRHSADVLKGVIKDIK